MLQLRIDRHDMLRQPATEIGVDFQNDGGLGSLDSDRFQRVLRSFNGVLTRFSALQRHSKNSLKKRVFERILWPVLPGYEGARAPKTLAFSAI